MSLNPNRVPPPTGRRIGQQAGVVALLTLLGHAPLTFGFGLNAAPGPAPADLGAQPNNFWSWDKGGPFDPITYAFDASFDAAFPDPLQKEQIHLAFDEWTDASGDASRRSAAASYHWNRRNTGSTDFWDLRTLATHEIGHVLGAGHPDALWFNTNPNTGSAYNLNYQLGAGGQAVAGPPIGGELMNEGNGPRCSTQVGVPIRPPGRISPSSERCRGDVEARAIRFAVPARLSVSDSRTRPTEPPSSPFPSSLVAWRGAVRDE